MRKPLKRCALYTRKSTEEGLEQDFNSLDAQREACAAYVKSQTSEGWKALAEHYDDGGFSGGSMERPALQRLLADIALGKVEVVVVYKIDRLTRSLPDFARMVELFDRHGVSFISVTQAFNTTTSMGRLTLNVLLSFAQFEREVTGRIFDAASEPMSPTCSYGKTGTLYRYYVSAPLQQGRKPSKAMGIIRRVSAPKLEAMLSETLRRLVPSKTSGPLDLVTRVEIHSDAVHVLLPARHLHTIQGRLENHEQAVIDPFDSSQLRLILDVRLQRQGGQTTIIGGPERESKPDPKLIKALRTAYAMVTWDVDGQPSLDRVSATYHQRRLVRLALLAPDIQRAVLAGRQPPGLTLKHLLEGPIPLLWEEQTKAFGFNLN